MAACGGKLDTFKALLSWGLSPTETDDYGRSAMSSLSKERYWPDATIAGFFKIMIDAGALEEEIGAMFSGTWIRRAPYVFPKYIWKYPDILQMMVGDRYEEYLQLPPQARFTYLSWGNIRPKLLLEQLSMGAGISPAALREVEGFNDSIAVNTSMAGKCLQMFARSYFCNAPTRLWEGLLSIIPADEDDHFRAFNSFHSWRELARWYLAGVPLQELTELRRVGGEYLTPFLCGISCTPFWVSFPWNSSRAQRCREKRWMMQGVSRATLFWLEDVQSAGIDLEEYGRRELAIYLSSSCTLRHRRSFGLMRGYYWSDIQNMRLVSFEYGPRPEDWFLVWDTDACEFSGEFWDLLENPPLCIPGGWVDDV